MPLLFQYMMINPANFCQSNFQTCHMKLLFYIKWFEPSLHYPAVEAILKWKVNKRGKFEDFIIKNFKILPAAAAAWVWLYSVFFNLNIVWEFCWHLSFVNFITLITLRWFGQFIKSRQVFLAIKWIAFLYISSSKCMGAQLWNSQTGFKFK